MKRWHWYVGRDTELLLDLDSDAALYYAIQRIRRNVRRGFLKLQRPGVRLYRSLGVGHYHLFVFLKEPMPPLERAVWELNLGSDIKRAQYNIMRTLRGLHAADLIIAERAYPGMRAADHVCTCQGKHKKRRITNHCPVLKELHGVEAGAEYFAIQRDRKPRTNVLRLPVGVVPLRKILNS